MEAGRGQRHTCTLYPRSDAPRPHSRSTGGFLPPRRLLGPKAAARPTSQGVAGGTREPCCSQEDLAEGSWSTLTDRRAPQACALQAARGRTQAGNEGAPCLVPPLAP